MNAFFSKFGRKSVPAAQEAAVCPAPPTAPATTPGESGAPRAAAPAARSTAPAEQAASGVGKRPPVSTERKAAAEVLKLTLGDFLHRIPTDLLASGPHDRSLPLAFDLDFLTERIWRGDNQIPVAEISHRVPAIFRAGATVGTDHLIRFPWKKVLALIEQARECGTARGLTASAVEELVDKLRARKLNGTAKPTAAGSRAPAPTRKDAGAAGIHIPTAPLSLSKAPEFALFKPPVTAPGIAEPNPDFADLAVAAAPTVKMELLVAEHQRQLAALTAERDQALAAIDPLRKALAKNHEQMTLERRVAAEVADKLDLLQQERGSIDHSIEHLKAERDAALGHATEIESLRGASNSRMGDIIAERDAAVARAGKLSADADATAVRMAELTAERDAKADSVRQITAARDAAIARATELTAAAEAAAALAAKVSTERDAALARTAEVCAERDAQADSVRQITAARDAAIARATELTAAAEAAAALAAKASTERDVALARTAEVCAERDAAVACATRFILAHQPPAGSAEPAPWESRANDRPVAEKPAAQSADTLLAASEEDVSSALIPSRRGMPRAIAAVAIGFVGISLALIAQINLDTPQNPPQPLAAVRPSSPVASLVLPATPAVSITEDAFTLETPADEMTMTLLPPGPLLVNERALPEPASTEPAF